MIYKLYNRNYYINLIGILSTISFIRTDYVYNIFQNKLPPPNKYFIPYDNNDT